MIRPSSIPPDTSFLTIFSPSLSLGTSLTLSFSTQISAIILDDPSILAPYSHISLRFLVVCQRLHKAARKKKERKYNIYLESKYYLNKYAH